MANTETSVLGTSQSTHSEILVNTEWMAQHLNDSNVRIIEADEDVLLYETRHISNTVKLAWHSDVAGSPDGAHSERMGTLTTPGGLKS